MKNITAAFIVIVVITMITTTALAAGPWRGKIIDIETKEPLEGVVVLAVWQRAYRTPAGDNTYFYKAKEVLSDKEGKFEISSYRPINMLPLISYIKGPYFTFFKPGHLSLSDIDFSEYFLKGVKKSPIERQEWRMRKIFRISPGIIELPMLKTREERVRVIGSLPPLIPDKAMPKLIKLMNIEEINLGLQPTHVRSKSR